MSRADNELTVYLIVFDLLSKIEHSRPNTEGRITLKLHIIFRWMNPQSQLRTEFITRTHFNLGEKIQSRVRK